MKYNHADTHLKHIVLFCGGRGSASIIRELLRTPTVQLTLIVNAYDDGLSTGSLRRYINGMLGPSDFRKNLSYLIDPHSKEQIGLKNFIEFRLPNDINENYVNHLRDYIYHDSYHEDLKPFIVLMRSAPKPLLNPIKNYLKIFLDLEKSIDKPFDYRDCSVGNLIFAGAYLKNNNSFNKATLELSQLFKSRAHLINVSHGENRVLVALKENGEILFNEAAIVSQQSDAAIKNIFFLASSIDKQTQQTLENLSMDEKEAWLTQHDAVPELSLEAKLALDKADIIIYGPGTQHSSLLPSYKIAYAALKMSPAKLKAFVMNLDKDHDIHSLTSKNLIDRALFFMKDESNDASCITHIFINNEKDNSFNDLLLLTNNQYKNSSIVKGLFRLSSNPSVHNGLTLITSILKHYENIGSTAQNQSIEFFIDLEHRPYTLPTLLEELDEIEWKSKYHDVTLRLPFDTHSQELSPLKTSGFNLKQETNISEIDILFDWLHHTSSEYLVLITGDGEYRFKDVLLGIDLLEQSSFAAVFGSRNQNSTQFRSSLEYAYGEKRFLKYSSFFVAFLMSAILAIRYRIILSDPLTGLRIFKRSRLKSLMNTVKPSNKLPAIQILKHLLKHNLEIAEIPVYYRTFLGFSNPNRRIKRGLKNLICALT